MPLNPSEPPHLRPTVSAESGAGAALSLDWPLPAPAKVSSSARLISVVLAARLLLIENQHRLVHLRIARAQFVHQHARLRILAAKAQDRGSGHVGVMDVAGQQSAKSLRILARAAAAALVGEKANAVEIGEDARRRLPPHDLPRDGAEPSLDCRLTSSRTCWR